MSVSAFPKPSLRPYLATDFPLLSEIRFAAIEELTVDDYDEAQRRAWAAAVDDDAAFAQSLEKGLTIVALIGGGPVGFICTSGWRPDRPALCPSSRRPHWRRERAHVTRSKNSPPREVCQRS